MPSRQQVSISSPLSGHCSAVAALSICGQFLASGADDGTVCMWRPDQCCFPIHTLPSQTACLSVKFSVEKPDLLYAAHAGDIVTWDVRNLGRRLEHWKISEDDINSIDLLEVEARMAVADDTGAVKIVATDSGEIIRTLNKHDNICSAAAFRPDRPWQVISAGLDCRLFVSDWKGSGLAVDIFEMEEIINPLSAVIRIRQTTTSSEYDDANKSDLSEEDEESDADGTSEATSYVSDVPVDPLLDGIDSVSTSVPGALEEAALIAQAAMQAAHGHLPAFRLSSLTETQSTQLHATRALGAGLPLNPPMINALTCTANGEYVVIGLESSTIELFSSSSKYLRHTDSLFGHRRGVSALLSIQNTHIISGSNDCNVFVWDLDSRGSGCQVDYGEKVSALQGNALTKIYVADCTPFIQMLDLSRC